MGGDGDEARVETQRRIFYLFLQSDNFFCCTFHSKTFTSRKARKKAHRLVKGEKGTQER